MEKIGIKRIEGKDSRRNRPECMSCGAVATKKVTFQDAWSVLKVNLCDGCARQEYEALNLQMKMDFPGPQ